MKPNVFISYSRKDIQEVQALKTIIQERIPQLKIWFDKTGIESGDEFQDKIVTAIDNSDTILFMLSENSLNSEWTKDEVMYAKNTNKRIIPILLPGAELKGWFLFRFGRIDFIDSTDEESLNKLVSNLADSFSLEEKNIEAKTSPSETTINSQTSIINKQQNTHTKNNTGSNNQPIITQESLGFNDETFSEYILATNGNGTAMYQLARRFYYGEGMEGPDKEKYVYWLKKAAEKGIVESFEERAKLETNDQARNNWLQKAYDGFKAQALNGDVESMYQLSLIIEEYFQDKWKEAIYWKEKAAENEHPQAMYQWFRYLSSGFNPDQGGVEKDLTKALYWIKKVAELGAPEAQHILGLMYAHGKGTEKDQTEAFRWILKAAEQGEAKAQQDVGLMYLQGRGVAENEQEAFNWILRAAKQGLAESEFMVGICYYQGQGVTKNDNEALQWLIKAARQGEPRALNIVKSLNLDI